MERIREQVQRIVNNFGFEVIDDEIDLRNHPNEDVLKFFHTFAKAGIVLFHGTNSQEKYSLLEVRQANDASKESGNKKAVYADIGIMAPLASALLHRSYLQSKFKSFTTGWDADESREMIFKFSPNVYKLIKSGDPNVFSDGYIYVLDKANFVNAEDAGTEWHSETEQKPILSCRVSKKLAEAVFIIDQDRSNIRAAGDY